MKKTLSFVLAVWMSLSVLAFSGGALDTSAEAKPGETQELIVYDLLKLDADREKSICRAVEIFFQNQFRNLDASKQIRLSDGRGQLAAVCMPRDSNNRAFDLYAPDGSYGVTLDPATLYFLTIPEGTYFTDDGILSAAFCGEYDGVYLTSNVGRYDVRTLGVQNFFAVKYDETHLYTGRIRVATAFEKCKTDRVSVLLYRRDGDEAVKVGEYRIVSFDRKKGAEIDFGGVKIDKYASYYLHIRFGTFTGPDKIIGDNTDYDVSGKKLLNLREDYPAIDMLIKWFGADHWTLKAIVTVLKVLSKLKLVDTALYKDVDKYISDRK